MQKGDDYQRITSLFCAGDFEQGLKEIERLRGELAEPVLLECLGNMNFYQRHFQAAIVEYEKAMGADPAYDVARYHYIVGVQEERARNFVDAFKRYQAAVEIEPDFVDAYVELGGLLAKVGDYEGALTCYTDALRIDGNDLRNYYNRMKVLESLSKSNQSRYGAEHRAAQLEFSRAKTRLPPIDESAEW